ncbi:arginyl-tRNA synthetase [Mytilus galloprovincialis]|uniref:Probable arginine--tRNA ligase, mitochondrial n=1 Tax=Mytilus galloprovincialis TaxID=29158 RepID=A0A8B6FGF0_MYTGA|nr:arginyl-tRNA synthetase [Mytilus galloprovincialis]
MGKERNGSLTETNGNTRREPKRQGSTELYDMATKVMLIGDSGVGKTCLLVRFKDGAFLSGSFISTVGIDFRNKVVDVEGTKVKLQIWDTAGQERFRSITRAYYRDANALLLLYDVTNKASFDNIRAWLGEINEYAQEDVVIMLLGNKADMTGERMIRTEDGEKLAKVYVKINEDVSKEQQNSGPDKHEKGETHRKSLEIFRNMEQGTASEDLQLWKHFRDISIEKYREVYERLNIKFTDYEGESMYSKKSLELIEELKQRDLLHIDDTTGKGYIDIENEKDKIKAVVQKSDGSTLYLTRDIAAVLDRHKRYNFDRTHYVVEDGQDLHFKMLKGILKKLNVPWIQRYGDQIHIRFGRISNLSTRKGKAVFLDDILNEAKERIIKTIHNKQTSKVVESTETVADVLGVSSIIVQDLKEKRLNTYKFSWDKVLSFKGDSGIVLQYAHARLCSLIEQCGCDIHSIDFDTKYLTEPEAIQLILHIASYEDTVDKCLTSLEACHLVHYLFSLSKFISVAHRNLKVKDQPKEIAQTRLQVFKCAKTTLANGMTLLGITPLDKM